MAARARWGWPRKTAKREEPREISANTETTAPNREPAIIVSSPHEADTNYEKPLRHSNK
jgi:hypothetical protein